MSRFSVIRGGGPPFITYGADYVNSLGTLLTPGGSNNTKGSWTQIISAAENYFSSEEMQVYFLTDEGTAGWRTVFTDIAIGPTGEQQPIVENLFTNATTTAGAAVADIFNLPVRIPSGVDVWARCQATTTSRGTTIIINRKRPTLTTPDGFSRLVTYGADESLTRGTSTTDPTVVDTFSPWIEIGTNLPDRDLKGIIIDFRRAQNSWTFCTGIQQIGIGPVDEQKIISTTLYSTLDEETPQGMVSTFIPIEIHEGARLWARNQASNLGGNDNDLDPIIYGAY